MLPTHWHAANCILAKHSFRRRAALPEWPLDLFLWSCFVFLLPDSFPSSLPHGAVCFSPAFSLFMSRHPAEPSRSHGGADSKGHGEESEPSDDEMLSLSGQSSNTTTAPPKPLPPSATPAAPAEEVDLLGLGREDIDRRCPSSQASSTAAAATDLLGDLFGAPPQPTSGSSSTQSTPHKAVPNTASPCPSPAPPGETTRSALVHISRWLEAVEKKTITVLWILFPVSIWSFWNRPNA